MPTGFARVARELFTRLPQDRFDLAYLGGKWPGSARFGFPCYSGQGFCQAELPEAAIDFAGLEEPFILWTLMDPWQVSWLAVPQTSPLCPPGTRKFLRDHRDRIAWIGHWPIDGEGPNGGPARWTEEYFTAMDFPVAMSKWGQAIVQKVCPREVRYISHAVDTAIWRPGNRDEARRHIESSYVQYLIRTIITEQGLGQDDRLDMEGLRPEIDRRRLRLGDRFTIVTVMANRERKYWWETLQAFRLLLDDVPEARLIGLCGDRGDPTRAAGDQLPLDLLCQDLGLRLDHHAERDPNVWLIETVMQRDGTPWDEALALITQAADVCSLISAGEGFGLPQLEAHACGKPCTVGAYSASVELAVHPRELIEPSGYYWTGPNQIKRPVYSPGRIVKAWRRAARDAEWRREVGAAGVEQGNARSWTNILPQWIDMFAEAAAAVGQRVTEGKIGAPSAVTAPATEHSQQNTTASPS